MCSIASVVVDVHMHMRMHVCTRVPPPPSCLLSLLSPSYHPAPHTFAPAAHTTHNCNHIYDLAHELTDLYWSTCEFPIIGTD